MVLPADPGKSLVVRRMREFKDAITARDADTILFMAKRWLQVENALEAQITLLVTEIQAAGLEANLPSVYKLSRYNKLLSQAQREIARYDAWAADYIASGQAQMATLGIQHAAEALQLIMMEGGSQTFFDRINVEAVELMIGNAGKGGPVYKLLQSKYQDAAARMTDALIQGIAFGIPPGKTAEAMMNGMGYSLDHALTVARTEQLRVYREAARQQYEASGVVLGYKRFAAKDPKTCALCLALDGEVYPTSELMNVHPNDRCTMIPIVRGAAEITWESGEDWLRKQDEEIQKQVLGSGALDLWKSGQIELKDLVHKTEHEIWGPSLKRNTLASLAE